MKTCRYDKRGRVERLIEFKTLETLLTLGLTLSVQDPNVGYRGGLWESCSVRRRQHCASFAQQCAHLG